MNISEVRLYSSQGKDGVIDSAKVVIEGQEFLCRLMNGEIEVVGKPEHPVKAWRGRAKAIAYARIVNELFKRALDGKVLPAGCHTGYSDEDILRAANSPEGKLIAKVFAKRFPQIESARVRQKAGMKFGGLHVFKGQAKLDL